MALVTYNPQLEGDEAVEDASYEKDRPPDKIYEDGKTKILARLFPPASMREPTIIFDLGSGSNQLGPFASQKWKRKLDSEDMFTHFPEEEIGNSKRILQLQQAWVIHSVWASIENVCKILSSVSVNKPQCKHIAAHFKVIGDVLKKMGLGEDFVSAQALQGGNGVQTNFSFDEIRFNHIAKTFKDHYLLYPRGVNFEAGSSLFRTLIQDVSSMFENYIRVLPTMDGSSEDSLSKHLKISEGFQNFSLQRMSIKGDVEAQDRDQIQHPLDRFLCLLLGVLKRGEDLVLFHLGLEGANDGVVERTGLYGEKFVEIHELLYELLLFYDCLDHCEGTEFAWGYSSQCDSCRAQSLLYYLNSNCLGEYASLSIDDNFLNIELATRISELLESSNCILKTLCIESFSRIKDNQEELHKCYLTIIAALSTCVSLTDLTIHSSNGEEIHELCNSLLANKVVENLIIWIDVRCNDNHAMDLSTMLKKNRSLKSFTLNSNHISIEGVAYFGAMLSENSSLKELHLHCSAVNEIGMLYFMWPLMTDMGAESNVNLSLKHLGIDITNVCRPGVAESIAKLLRTNKTLSHFSIKFKDWDPSATCKIFNSLKINKSLKVINLQGWSRILRNSKVAACLEAMLVENSTLEELKVDMRMLDELCLKHLLRPLTAKKDGEPCVNRSLKQLHIHYYGHQYTLSSFNSLSSFNQGWRGEKSIAKMLHTNETLRNFSMTNASLNTSGVCKILNSLKVNKALQVLNLDECKGLDDPQVKVAFMDLLVNYNFTIHTIKMHGREWDIEAFMKSKLELDTIMEKERLKNLDGGICESPTLHNAHDLKKALEKGEGSSIEVHVSFGKFFEEYQEKLFGECSSKPEVMFGLVNKLEGDSERFLQELTPSLESVMKSTNFLLRRNLNMVQLLQERYAQWNSFSEMCPSNLTNDEKDELSKGCIIAALFPTTFQYHLKAQLLQGLNHRGILQTLKEVVGLVVQRVKSLQDTKSQIFQFIDYIDFQAPFDDQHIYSPKKTIAICQTFSTKIGIGEELQAKNSIQYGIVQDHLTSAYYFHSDKASNLDELNIDKSNGVIGVKVTSIEVQIEIMWEDGSYYSGTLEDFSYDLQSSNNKQCALEAFGDLKGAQFLRTRGLKCSPLLVIALAMAIQKRGLALTWSGSKGHIQSNSIIPSQQPTELEVWECQILFGINTNQLVGAVEWGMNEFDENYCRDNQREVVLEQDPNINFSNDFSTDNWSSDGSNDTSSHTLSNLDASELANIFNAGVQDKNKVTLGFRICGNGVDIGFDLLNSKGKQIKHQAFEKIQQWYGENEGGFVIAPKLDGKHHLLRERLLQGSLYAEPDLNYLVVYDSYKTNHVSIYWVKESNDTPRLELKWITDIFIKGGLEKTKKIFRGLKGETLEVIRKGTDFLESGYQQQSKGLMKKFTNQFSNKYSCKDKGLQMVSICEVHPQALISNDEWKHIVGELPYEPTKFCLKASYMKAITYSKTRYSSGVILSTHTIDKYGLKWGRARKKSKLDESNYVHDTDEVKSYAKFSKPPHSLSSKWHETIYWGGYH